MITYDEGAGQAGQNTTARLPCARGGSAMAGHALSPQAPCAAPRSPPVHGEHGNKSGENIDGAQDAVHDQAPFGTTAQGTKQLGGLQGGNGGGGQARMDGVRECALGAQRLRLGAGGVPSVGKH